MIKLRTFLFSVVLLSMVSLVPLSASAGPGDYSLTALGGPSFNVKNWHHQGRLGGEFDYELGYGMGFGMMGLFGVSDRFRFSLMPLFRYEYFYLGPAAFYGVFGAGYGIYDTKNAMDIRFGTGLSLPLGDRFIFKTDANLFVAPVGLDRTVVTMDWLIGLGVKFR